MTRWKLVAVLAAVTALGGCSSGQSWAVKLTPTGLPQFVDTACGAPAVTEAWVQADSKDVWRVGFAPPAKLRELAVGQKPEGLQEKVAWQRPNGDARLTLTVRLEDGSTPAVEFTLDGLRDGKVKFEDDYLSGAEFEQERAKC
ncbi:hypothetical protein [Lentzea sp. NPDC003310]|uniref:hypothetical protein n=1 Tax=Lentzea sp. NPDC003310 TaxID=3154447 RepID=UPI0033A3BE9B